MYFGESNHFASVIELACKGKGIKIVPENLSVVDPREVIVGNKQGKHTARPSSNETIRDLIRLYTVNDNPVIFNVLLGLEEQTFVDYRMPLRTAYYDIRRLADQMGRRMREIGQLLDKRKIKLDGGEFLGRFLKTDRIIPVVTSVLYLGCEPWDGPRTLRDMYTDLPDDFRSLTLDYNMHLIDPHDLTPEELASLLKDLSLLFRLIGSAGNKKEASAVFATEKRYHSTDNNTAALISAILGISLPKDEGKEVDMTNCYREAMKERVDNAREETREEMLGVFEELAEKYGDELPAADVDEVRDMMARRGNPRPEEGARPSALTT